MSESSIALFEGKEVRKTFHQGAWWFSIVDVVEVLTETDRPRKYWSDLKQKLQAEGSELSDKIGQLKLPAPDGKLRATDCATTPTTLRIIQSIPSPKAEPFKRWLAQVGYERIQEIDNPELAMKRMRAIYEAKGYQQAWIDKRVRGIAVRDELTDEWRQRGVQEGREYSILTAEISKATFGMTPSEYKKFKKLKHQNLRDHMSDLELIFTMLGEASTTEIARNQDAQGFGQNKAVAARGGKVAGDARRKLEVESGRNVSTRQNFLPGSTRRKIPKGT